jgi:NhaP-type Na+/H+ and K+/H+ antiporter
MTSGMPLTEPTIVAVLLLVVGVLLVVSALFSRAASRVGVPGFLIFLAVGMLAGSEGIGGDHLFVFCQAEDRAFLELLFGHREAE